MSFGPEFSFDMMGFQPIHPEDVGAGEEPYTPRARKPTPEPTLEERIETWQSLVDFYGNLVGSYPTPADAAAIDRRYLEFSK